MNPLYFILKVDDIDQECILFQSLIGHPEDIKMIPILVVFLFSLFLPSYKTQFVSKQLSSPKVARTIDLFTKVCVLDLVQLEDDLEVQYYL